MVTFSFIKPPARGSLRRRRMADALRRLTAALCVGLAVLFGLEAVLAVVETEPMVVAARSIRRGDIILAADVQLADMPAVLLLFHTSLYRKQPLPEDPSEVHQASQG